MNRTGLHVVEMPRHNHPEWFLTATPRPGEGWAGMFDDVRQVASETGATLVSLTVYGVPASERAAAAGFDCPVTWLLPGDGPNLQLTGVQAHAVKGPAIERIRLDDRVVGTLYDDGHARQLHLGSLQPPNLSGPPPRQARAVLETMETVLRRAGMSFSNVVRTWFFLHRILDWYGEFNGVRNEFFRQRRVYDGLVPASTGIGAANPAGAAVVADAYALAPLDTEVRIRAVPSPLQAPALEYGSSFSRAVEVVFPGGRELEVSGTASIEPSGRSVHNGDFTAQMDLTLRVVEAILKSRQMDWADTTRAVAYIKDSGDGARARQLLAGHVLGERPLVITENTVCRPELLFELELDARREG